MSRKTTQKRVHSFILALLSSTSLALAQGVPPPLLIPDGGTGGHTAIEAMKNLLGSSVPTVFAVRDYGPPGTCGSGVFIDDPDNPGHQIPNDDIAVNATIAAAKAFTIAQHRNAKIAGAAGPDQPSGCRIRAVNATDLYYVGNGTDIWFDDITFTCNNTATPSTNNNWGTCIDFTGSSAIVLGPGFHLSGNGETGMVFGSPTGVANPILPKRGCGSFTMFGVHVIGNFKFANIYDDQCETFHLFDVNFQNNNNTPYGPIGAGTSTVARPTYGGLGAIVPGSGGTADGLYSDVPLTGGTGTEAIADITVSGGVVTNVYVTYEGRDYVVGDVLSASPSLIGNVSGFSVPVQQTSPKVAVFDALNHWRHKSVFLPVTTPIETFGTLTGVMSFGSGFVANSRTQQMVPLWIAYARSIQFTGLYTSAFGDHDAPNVQLFDPFPGSSPPARSGFRFNFIAENDEKRSTFFFYGKNPTQEYDGMEIYDDAEANDAVFALDTNITSMTAHTAKWTTPYINHAVLEDPSKWTIDGMVMTGPQSSWPDAQINFSGMLCAGTNSCKLYIDSSRSTGRASGYQFLNTWTGVGAIMDFDAPSMDPSGSFNMRLFNFTKATAAALNIYKPDGTENTVQSSLSGSNSSYMHSYRGSLSVGPGSQTVPCAANVALCGIGAATQVAGLRSGTSANSDLTGRVTLSGGTATQLLTNVYTSAPNCLTRDVTTPTNSSFATEHASGTPIAATSLVNGVTYTIVSIGFSLPTTDFTAIGAANNNIGTIFTATGPASGGAGTAATPGSVVFTGTGTDVLKYVCAGTN